MNDAGYGKKYHIGYTQGVFDMFHIGHLNLIQSAKEQCDYLIVGVNTDELVEQYKHKKPVIGENNRRRIVEAIRYVDRSVLCKTLDKTLMYRELKFDAVFIGDDWKGSDRWTQTEKDLRQYGVQVVYLPYTEGVSSTGLLDVKNEKVSDSF